MDSAGKLIFEAIFGKKNPLSIENCFLVLFLTVRSTLLFE